MLYEKIVQELETYLSVCPVEISSEETKHQTNQDFAFVKEKSKTAEQGELIRHLSAFTDHIESKDLVEAVLDHCNDETLDELLQTYGEDSAIAKLIRSRQPSRISGKVPCELNTIETTVAQMLIEARRQGNPFYESVCKYIDRLGLRSDAAFYNSISMPRQQFARLRDARNTLSKQTVLWIIVGLRLSYLEATELLRTAGYFFRKNDMRDVILSYILRNTEYDLDMVNQVLYHFDIPALC